MEISTLRIYENGPRDDSAYRVLVDRLWPRGISKKEAGLDAWWKELAPSSGLRKWFDHDPEKWPEFQKKYRRELGERKETAISLLKSVPHKNLVLLYGAKNTELNQAVVLKDYLEALAER